ncbi:7976_t:CDS:2 [Racocetra fulgida]|uniref:7976_t:CDS:1 n=1 Tax=Racocetra fulgida TaxID=60492 RepID=A0A9N9JHG7_9GLOM|nr:7976_t:CDS:2 [Racocetra fulgida]
MKIDSVEQTNANIEPVNSDNSDSINNSGSNVKIVESSENSEVLENIEIVESSDESENEDISVEEGFDNYLQEWVEMGDDNDEISLNNTVHPAIDLNAKWELATLFKKLDLEDIF